jgi:ABC-type Zn uptake system ZnuABC Zn-binding protein ZnuA
MRTVAVALLFLSACAANPDEPAPGRRVILTTFQPLFSFARAVVAGDPGVEVWNLAPRKEGPHDFNLDDPAVGARCRPIVEKAEAVITLRSLPVAPAFDRLYPWCRVANLRIVEIDPSAQWEVGTPRLPLIADPPDTARARERGEAKGPVPPNPHIWLSLSHAVRLVERISNDIVTLDPTHRRFYWANTARYQARLRALKAEFEKRLAGADRVATLTEAFPYLTADFGLGVADYILEPKDSAEVGERVRAAKVKVVLAEGEPEAKVRAAVEQAGAKVVVLRTLEAGWGEGERVEPDGYLRGMRDNLEKLAGAFGL